MKIWKETENHKITFENHLGKFGSECSVTD